MTFPVDPLTAPFHNLFSAGDISEDGTQIILRGKEGKNIPSCDGFKIFSSCYANLSHTLMLSIYQHILLFVNVYLKYNKKVKIWN